MQQDADECWGGIMTSLKDRLKVRRVCCVPTVLCCAVPARPFAAAAARGDRREWQGLAALTVDCVVSVSQPQP